MKPLRAAVLAVAITTLCLPAARAGTAPPPAAPGTPARPSQPAPLSRQEAIAETAPAPVPGKVSYIAAVVDPQTRAVAVRIVADNPGGALKKDLCVKVRIHSSTRHHGLLAPVSTPSAACRSTPIRISRRPWSRSSPSGRATPPRRWSG